MIVVDGAARGNTRLKCCRAALTRLRPAGMIILDNSGWLPESSRVLREAGLLQVDMTGLVPIGKHTQTTSFFFHRDFVNCPSRAAPADARSWRQSDGVGVSATDGATARHR